MRLEADGLKPIEDVAVDFSPLYQTKWRDMSLPPCVFSQLLIFAKLVPPTVTNDQREKEQ